MPKKSNKVNVRDLSGCIQPSNVSLQGAPTDNKVGQKVVKLAEYFTVNGRQDFLDEDGYPQLTDEGEFAFAKKVSTNSRKPLYYIKGGTDGHFFDPLGMYDERMHNKFKGHAGKFKFEFVQVNERAFAFYINYLRTKNRSYLLNAEREVF